MDWDTVLFMAGNRIFTAMQYSVVLAFIVLVVLPILSNFLCNFSRIFGKGR